MSTQAEIDAQVQKIHELIPEVFTSSSYKLEHPDTYGAGRTNGVRDAIVDEQEFVQTLRRSRRYMQLNESRAEPQMFSFRLVSFRSGRGRIASEEWTRLMNSQESKNPVSEAEREDELMGLLKEWPKRNLNGFLNGWAALVPPESRRIFAEPDPDKLFMSLSDLIRANVESYRVRFNAENYGLDKNWSLSDLENKLHELQAVDQRVAYLTQKLYGKDQAWILDKDWNESVGLELSGRQENGYSALRDRLSRRYAAGEGEIQTEAIEQELILREVPPWLGIYRGCIGNDCSTSNSRYYPYSPFERVWWIEDVAGKHLGYVGGALTKVGRKPALYLRDITGPGLTYPAEQIPLIIAGFDRIKSKYDAKILTIMPRVFTQQNHFQEQENILKEFPSEDVEQTLRDGAVRGMLTDSQHSSDTYDDATDHQSVRKLLEPKELGANVRVVELDPSGLPADTEPRSYARVFWDRLEAAVKSKSPVIMKQFDPEQKVDWNSLFMKIRNSKRLPIEEFYKNVEDALKSNNLPVTKRLMKAHESLFTIGNFRAPDAFAGEKNERQSIRYIMDLIWRSPDPAQSRGLIRKHTELLEHSDMMIRAVRSLFERRQQVDVKRIEALWDGGYRFLEQQLSPSEWTWVAAQAEDFKLKLWAVKKALPDITLPQISVDATHAEALAVLATMLDNSDQEIDESYSVTAADILSRIQNLTVDSSEIAEEIKSSINQDDNPRIKLPLAIAYLHDGHTKDDTAAAAYTALNEALQDKSVPIALRKRAREALDELPVKAKKFLNKVTDCETELATKGERSRNF